MYALKQSDLLLITYIYAEDKRLSCKWGVVAKVTTTSPKIRVLSKLSRGSSAQNNYFLRKALKCNKVLYIYSPFTYS